MAITFQKLKRIRLFYTFLLFLVFSLTLLSPHSEGVEDGDQKIPTPQPKVTPNINYRYLKEELKNWKFNYSKEGIDVFERDVADSNSLAFRGIGIINAPLIGVLTAIREVETSKEWTPNVISKKLIKLYTHIDGVTYTHNFLPWPAKDRDTLIRSTLIIEKNLDGKEKFINIMSKSVEMAEVPLYDDKIRGDLYSSNLILKPLSDNRTYVDLSAHFDPKGWIPKWVVNFVQKDWPFKFLKGLEKRAAERVIPNPHPDFVQAITEVKK